MKSRTPYVANASTQNLTFSSIAGGCGNATAVPANARDPGTDISSAQANDPAAIRLTTLPTIEFPLGTFPSPTLPDNLHRPQSQRFTRNLYQY
jgi:hypothetical protein